MSESKKLSFEDQRSLVWHLGQSQSSLFEAIRIVPEDQDMLAIHQTLRAKMEKYAPDFIDDKIITEDSILYKVK